MAGSVDRDATEATRAVAMHLFKVMDDIPAIDALLAPDAEWWVNGIGHMKRKNFLAVHKPLANRPQPSSRKRTLVGLTVEGERAAIEMELEMTWPDMTYHQFYHHVLIVRNGKICSLREYSNRNEGTRLYGSVEEIARIGKQ